MERPPIINKKDNISDELQNSSSETPQKNNQSSFLSGIGKAGRRTTLALGLTLSTLGGLSAQNNTSIVENVKDKKEKILSIEELRKIAEEKPFMFFDYLNYPDSLIKEVLPIAEENILKTEPGRLIVFLSSHRENKLFFNKENIERAFNATLDSLENGTAHASAMHITGYAELLSYVTNGREILERALKYAEPEDILDSYPRESYLKLPYGNEVVEPYIKGAIDRLLEKKDFLMLPQYLDLFIDQPWAEDVIKEIEKNSPENLPLGGTELLKTDFGQETLIRVLSQHPRSFLNLNLGGKVNNPELSKVLVNAVNIILNEVGFDSDFFRRSEIFNNFDGGKESFLKISQKTASDYPEYFLYFLAENESANNLIDDEEKKSLIKEAVFNYEHPVNLISYVHLFSAEPYAEEIIKKIGDSRPELIIKFFEKLNPKEKYHSFIESLIEKEIKENPHHVLINLHNAVAFLGGSIKEQEDLMKDLFLRTAEGDKDLTRVANNFEYFFDQPWAYDGLKKSMLKDPRVVQSLWEDGTGIDLLKKETDPYIKEILKINSLDSGPVEVGMEYKDGALAAVQYITDFKIDVTDVEKFSKEQIQLFKAYMYSKEHPNPVGVIAINEHMGDLSKRLVYKINALHNSPDEIRFASIEDFSFNQLYMLSVYGEEEVFTSTFNGIFNRMISKMDKENISGYKMISNFKFEKARNFIRECASYNRLNEFLGTMSKEEKNNLFKWFIEEIGQDEEFLREGSVVADVMASVNDPEILKICGESLKAKYIQSTENNDKKMQTIYGLLCNMYSKEAKDSSMLELNQKYKFESLEVLHVDEVFNPDGSSIHRYFFYNDKDGVNSFQNFLSQYRSDDKWKIINQGDYVNIISVKDKKVSIFANKPEKEDAGNGQIDSLFSANKLSTNVVVHRGHSYHAYKTIERIPVSVKLVSLGSCGGYQNISEVLNKASDAQILATKGTGTMLVNDPILKAINEEIRNGHDLKWEELWSKFESGLGNDDRFKDYVSPDKNLGLIFLRTYNKLISEKENK